jgi:hypothetical protein
VCASNGSTCPAQVITTLVGVSETQQFLAEGTYTDMTTKYITQSVIWTSSDPAGATVTSISSGGLTTSVGTSPLDSSSSPTASTITATSSDGTLSGSASLTVDASFNSGSGTVYDMLSTSFSLSLNGTTGNYSCAGCHASTDSPAYTPTFYVAADPATTLTNMQTYGESAFYTNACKTTPAGMPSFQGATTGGVSICTLLQEWVAENGPP